MENPTEAYLCWERWANAGQVESRHSIRPQRRVGNQFALSEAFQRPRLGQVFLELRQIQAVRIVDAAGDIANAGDLHPVFRMALPNQAQHHLLPPKVFVWSNEDTKP